jgi:glycosyl transferase family WbsX
VLGTDAPVRVIAFHLPQFHPIPENDTWWGRGFTEWTSTVRARPLFLGHRQPHLPADLGFYDLRLAEARTAQADLAREYRVSAFCYWHYWFAGRRILERPVDEIVACGEPDIGFCLGWANQTWAGVWHGEPDRVLIEQSYPGAADDEAHFAAVLPALGDRRYFTVEGRPLFYVFRPEEIPDIASWCRRWRDMARASGLPGLYLVAEMHDGLGEGVNCDDPRGMGFDAGVYVRLPADNSPAQLARVRIRRKLSGGGPDVYPYLKRPAPLPSRHLGRPIYPAVFPNWDNTPRSGRNGLVLRGSHPEHFQRHVEAATRELVGRPPDERIVFVKSWNEWAEGNYLEPDAAHGRGWLEALRTGVERGWAAA